MEVFSAALSLLAIFLVIILCVPVVLVLVLFLTLARGGGNTGNLSKDLQTLFNSLFRLKPTQEKTKKKVPTKAKAKDVKPANVEDADFREIKS